MAGTYAQMWRSLRGLARRANEPTAPADYSIAERMGAVFWLIGAVIATALLPFFPPNDAIGDPGWVVAAAGVLGSVAIGYRRLAPSRKTSLLEIYIAGYFGLAMIVTLEWLAGGRPSPYHFLYLLPVLYAAAAHRPARVLAFWMALAIVIWAPVLYEGASEAIIANIATELVMLSAIGLAVWLLFVSLRLQRDELRKARELAESLARMDTLTKLGNRRAFTEALERERARSERSGAPLSLVLADLDDFKQLNDTRGHLMGDRALQAVARTLEDSSRRADACYRWAGDEFVVLLPDTGESESEELCERIAGAVAELELDDAGPLSITCAGAELASGQGTEDLLRAADRRLMERKRGRSVA